MADLRITPNSQALTPTRVAGASDTVKAAQRAFFNAALGQAPSQTVVRSTSVASASTAVQPVITPRTIVPPPAADTDRPTRMLRPGSLLDIKV